MSTGGEGPAPFSPLGASDVHVWRFSLDPPTDLFAAFDRSLSDDERRRAARFRMGHLRRRYIAGRGGLRDILSRYLGCVPEAVAFSYGPHGKPGLDGEHRAVGLEFNLTHSHELAMCAVTRVGLVGVDVEEHRAMEEHGRKLIGRFFSPVEQSEFLALPEHDRLASFFRGWTRKEAYLKAVGTGLSTELDSFDVTLGHGVLPALLRVGNDPTEHEAWFLCDLDPGPGYAAALAVRSEAKPVNVSVFELFRPSA